MKAFFPIFALSVIMTCEAHADVFEPKMKDICRPAPTSENQSRVKPKLLFGYLITDAVTISDFELNRDGDTVSYEQKVNAVLAGSTYCSTPGSKCLDDPKLRDATNEKLGKARVLLADYFQRHSVPVRANEGGYQYTFERNEANVRAFFLNPNSQLTPLCIAAKAADGLPSPPIAEDKSRASGRLLVRNSVGDLHVAQSDTAFKGLQRASFAINSDRLQSTTTYNIQGVLGYGMGQSHVPSWSGAYAEIIPYVSYTRQFVDGRNPAKLSNVENIGVGVLADLLFPAVGLQNDFPLTRGIYNDLQFSSQIVHSNVKSTDLISGKVTYTPYINPLVVPGIATPARVGDLLVVFTPQAVFIYGEVLNAGSNPALAQTGTFQRLGAHLAFAATVDTGPLSGVGLNVAYDYLKSYGGQISQISLWTAALSYTMPKQEYWSVQLKYIDGRNLDTLEQQQLVTLGIGLKY